MRMSFASNAGEVLYGQIRKISLETCEVGDAPPEERHPEKRLGRSREEPQAGDRDRPERSQTEGRQGSKEVVSQAIEQPETILMPAGRHGPIRYAVVGLGHIAQVAVLPAFAHAKRNSRLTAIVSDDAQKRRIVGKKYRRRQPYAYEPVRRLPRAGGRGVYRAAELDARRVHDPRGRERACTCCARSRWRSPWTSARQMIDACRRAPRQADDRLPPAFRRDQPRSHRSRATRGASAHPSSSTRRSR